MYSCEDVGGSCVCSRACVVWNVTSVSPYQKVVEHHTRAVNLIYEWKRPTSRDNPSEIDRYKFENGRCWVQQDVAASAYSTGFSGRYFWGIVSYLPWKRNNYSFMCKCGVKLLFVRVNNLGDKNKNNQPCIRARASAYNNLCVTKNKISICANLLLSRCTRNSRALAQEMFVLLVFVRSLQGVLTRIW